MRTSQIKLLGLATLMFSTSALAVGMGEINVSSALGEKLKADIALVAVTKAEKVSLVARLASPDSYKNAGIEYPYNNKFKFEMVNRADGEPYLRVNSDQPINDPFVVMMVELNWASGRLVREYTFLLDPPNFVADQPASIDVQPVAPSVPASPIEATPVKPVVVATPVEAVVEPVAPTPIQTKTAPMSEAKPIGKFNIAPNKSAPMPAVTKAADTYVVKRGDTLAKIASEDTSSGVSLERTIVALYRANADEFDGKNMNRISVGKTLHLPSEKELASVTQADAITEIRAQAQDWNAYRQKLASAATNSIQSQATHQSASGKISSTVADKAPVAKESAKEVLKLSKGEAPGDKALAKASGGKSASVQEKKDAAKEDSIAKAHTLKEGQARTALLEKNLKDLEKLAKLKVEAAALAQKQAPIIEAPKVTPASAAVAVTPVQPEKAETMQSKPEPSLVDTVLAEPTYLAGGAAGLLGLLGLGWWATRRKKAPVFEDVANTPADIGSTTGQMATPAVPSPDTGDFTQKVTPQPEVPAHSEEVDPISEADLFLNFGRDGQAEEILKDALTHTPNNHQIHLKLLGIYANRKDLGSFENIARQLHDSGDESAFKQASDMGREIDPRNTLYGGSEALEDAGSATMQAPAFGAPKAVEVANKPVDIDFDLGAEPPDQLATSPEQHFLDDSQNTLSTPTLPGQSVTALPNLDDLIFDVTGNHPTLPMGKSLDSPEVAKIEDPGMEFILDFPTSNIVDAAQPAPIAAPALDLSGISLNLDDVPTFQSGTQEKSDLWHEVATKLDLAKAYQEMGDDIGAREILEEVLREGDPEQQQAAQSLIDKIA